MVFNNLIDSIEGNDYALTAGDIGYHFLVRVLSEKGRSDMLYKMNNRSDKPGYGLQIKKGATSLTESWAALPNVSNLHMMLGHLMEWFYSRIGGYLSGRLFHWIQTYHYCPKTRWRYQLEQVHIQFSRGPDYIGLGNGRKLIQVGN